MWAVVAILTVGGVARGLAGWRRDRAASVAGLLVGGFVSGLLLVATGIAFWNNVSNLLTGLPLHAHP